ncbi:acyl-CoA dehydrogenase/oxidase [Mycena metata]|uniref:Acyl-CoA dehydrogenase/oxidase n=1 Tax=Mycena metata TaxID=1033252 RepID=A0AAD7N7J8_9AGAR|nr:acyl-CoA dehydrogenase/oxidase [Mycena metata]
MLNTPRNRQRQEAIRLLPTSPLFSGSKIFEGYLSYDRRVRLSLARAKAIVAAYSLTADEVETLAQPFWDLHLDLAMAMDTGAGTLVTIQLNLAAGTLVKYIKDHPAIAQTMDDILAFRVLAHYCLTEVAHGLDAINIETTAKYLPDGGFELHTPNSGAAKIMPATSPCGIPAVGVVFAKLIVKGQNYGVRPFVLPLNDGETMMPGITTRLLPPREGAPPIYHSITFSNHVKLPAHALLGPLGSASEDRALVRANHTNTIWRTTVGGLALGATVITARCRQRRTVGVPPVPILLFRTQHAPILIALAQTFVAKEFLKVTLVNFLDEGIDLRVRQAWAAIFKATLVDHGTAATLVLSSRCGAQGLFSHNGICALHSSIVGLSIAEPEGDVLALCIRLVSELLQKRYEIPKSTNGSGLLSRHEEGLFAENRTILDRAGSHRSAAYNTLVLPKSELMVRAIGHRIAYDAAVDAKLDPRITELYLASAVKQDAGWYAEHVDFGGAKQDAAENAALLAALPCLDEWFLRTRAERYSQVPILSAANWKAFTHGLRGYNSVENAYPAYPTATKL